MKDISGKKSFFLITFLVVVWGLSWPIYKITLNYTPPLLFAGMRTFFGGLLIAVCIFPRRNQIRWKENWKIYCLSAILNVVLFFALQTIGLMYLPSGLFSVLVYLQPVLVGILSWLWLHETMTPFKIIGLLIGFIGVGVVSSGGFSGHIAMIGIVLALLTGISWAFGTVYVKKMTPKVDSMWLTATQFMMGGAFLTALGSGVEKFSDIVWDAPYLLGLLFGIVLGVSATWLIYFTLVNAGDASKVASYTFLVPLISVLSGTIWLREPFTINLFIGMVLIAFSIIMVNRKPKNTIENEPEAA